MKKYIFIVLMIAVYGTAAAGLHAQSIHELIKKGDIDSVRILLNENAGLIGQKDDNNNLPIHTAAETGNIEIGRLFFERGSSISSTADGFLPAILSKTGPMLTRLTGSEGRH